MSKATEWAEELRRRDRQQAPSFTTQFSMTNMRISVSDDGKMFLHDGNEMSVKDALAFARWIEETFG